MNLARPRLNNHPSNAHEAETVSSTIKLVDCTLRDGEQQPGVVFTREEKVQIAHLLDEIGIYEIEAGTPAVSEDDFDAISDIASAGLAANISALARARADDIQLVSRTGAWGVRVSLPVSHIQLGAKFSGMSEQQYLSRALGSCHDAKELGLYVIFSPFDTTRAEPQFLARILSALDRAATVDRVRLVDTVGSAAPRTIRKYLKLMQESCDIPIEAHCHNDFGLATANTLEAAMHGARYLSVTVNGLGERAGNAALEEVAVALEILYGHDTGLRLELLTHLAGIVESFSRVRLQDHKAIVGRNAFSHESGLVVSGVIRDPATAEPFAPELVGQTRDIVLGKLSGIASIHFHLQALGIELSEEDSRALLDRVKRRAVQTKARIEPSCLPDL